MNTKLLQQVTDKIITLYTEYEQKIEENRKTPVETLMETFEMTVECRSHTWRVRAYDTNDRAFSGPSLENTVVNCANHQDGVRFKEQLQLLQKEFIQACT